MHQGLDVTPLRAGLSLGIGHVLRVLLLHGERLITLSIIERLADVVRRFHRLGLLHHERRHVRVNCNKYFVAHAMRTFVVFSF